MSVNPKPRSSVSLLFFEGAIWSAARNLLQVVLNLTAITVVARELGPEAYGVYGIAMLVMTVAVMLVGSALTDSIVQRQELSDGHIDATFWLSSLSAGVVGALIAVFATPLARLAGGAQAAEVLMALGCLLPLVVGSAVPMALLARDLRFRVSSQIGVAATVLSCGSGIALALGGAGIWTLVAMEAIRAVVNLIGGFVSVTWRPGRRGRWQHVRELSRLNISWLATYSVGYADMLLPRLLVSHLLGAQALGLFLLAIRVLDELSNLLTGPMRTVASAACARTQDSRDELHRIITGLYRSSRLIVFPAFLGMAALSPFLIPWLFGSRWESAVLATQILMLSGLRRATGAFNGVILLSVGRPQLALILFGAGCVMHLVFFPALAPWGVMGAAIAMLGRQFCSWPLACLLIRQATGMPIRQQIGGGLSVLMAALAMAAVIMLFISLVESVWPIPAIVLAGALVGAVSYIAALRVLAPSTLRVAVALVGAFLRRDRAKLEAILTQAS